MELRVSYAVCIGNHKNVCDDTAVIGTAVVNNECGTADVTVPAVIALLDGVGGNSGGREASMFVAAKLADMPEPEDEGSLKDKLIGLNNSLLGVARENRDISQMATTLIGLYLAEDKAYLMQAGNSRLYTIRGGYLQQLTVDQTTYQWLKSIGQDDAAEFSNKSEIRCAFGGGKEKYLDGLIVEQTFERRMPDCLLLTTDGVHDTLTDDEIESILKENIPSLDKVRKLTEEALRRGTEDDRSAVIIDVI